MKLTHTKTKNKMKNASIFLLILICFLTCKQKNISPSIQLDNSKFSAVKNSTETWNAPKPSGSVSKGKKLINVFGTKSLNEYIVLRFKYKEIENLKSIKFIDSQLNYLIGGDVFIDSYSSDSTDENNTAQITEIDINKKQITGNFKVKLMRDKHWIGKRDTVNFKCGQFVINYVDYP